MRILQVIPVFSAGFGGPVSVVRSISKELAKRHEVVVYTTTALDSRRDVESSSFEVESDGYQVVYFPRIFTSVGFNISPAMAKGLDETLSEYDIVHLHSWRHFQDMIVHHYAKKYGVPYVLQAHGSLPRIVAKQKLKWMYDVLFGCRLLRDSSKVIALSQREVQQYKAAGVSEKRISVIPNGIDLSEYANLPPKGSFRKKFDIDDEQRIVLYLGRIYKSKGLDLLAEAFSIISKTIDKVTLVVVGPDDGYSSTFSRLISNLCIKEKVLLAGFVEGRDKLAALVDSEVFVTPCFHGFPVTFLEALLTDCPIVTTSDELDWVHNNVGYVVEVSPVGLARGISTILQDISIHARFRENCRETIKNFGISTVVHSLEDTYKSVVRK